MGDVIDLDAARQHMTGPARCIGCGHEWEAVAPVGTCSLTCPACGIDKGGRFAMVLPTDDGWHCNCGNCFFLFIQGALFCPNCGLEHGLP